MNIRHVLLGAMAVAPGLLLGANIDRSTLTEVVNSVRIIEPASKKSTPAKVQNEFIAPHVLRTGVDSRAEMVAPDQTVTRVGQNTVFSFAPGSREVELQKGSILFQSPSGKGGGTIRTPAASAAVLGTTLIVTATKNGGFKVLLVEGKGRVRSADGTTRNLTGGQMVYALPGGKLSGIFEFRLSQQVAASTLVSGFKKKLPSADKIQKAINKQEKEIASGKAIDTGLLASGSPSIAYQVDVAFDTLVNEEKAANTVTATRFQAAAASDAIVSQPALDAARVFVPEDIDPLEFPGDSRPFFGLGDSDSDLPLRATNAAQFVASNILFDSPSVSLNSYLSRDAFRFLALNDVLLNQSVDFGTFPGVIQIWAGGTIQAAQGKAITVRAAAPVLALVAFGDQFSTANALPSSLQEALSTNVPLRLAAFTAENTDGALGLVSGNIQLAGVRLGAKTNLFVGASNDLAVTNKTTAPEPNALSTDTDIQFPGASVLTAGDLVNVRTGGDLALTRSAVRAPQIRINAGQRLKLTAVQINDTSAPPQNSLGPTGPERTALRARELADLNQVNFLANDVLISARTVKLTNVQFRLNSDVVLESQVGQLAPNPNTNQPARPGFVNFVRNVFYGDIPAQNAITTNGNSIPGIVIRRR